MPVLAVLLVVCQIICGVHVVRRGNNLTWLFLIILLPLLGCLIYFFSTLWPEIQSSRRARLAVSQVNDRLDPERHLRALRSALQQNNSQQNRLLLADELLRLKRSHEAIPLYQKSLQGNDLNAPDILLKLAHGQFEQTEYAACKNTLERLIQHNPDFRSSTGHLLYARSLSALQQWPEAEHEFCALLPSYSGPQARYHYAQMLLEAGKAREAREQLLHIEQEAMHAGSHYQRLHRDCLQQAQQGLKALQ